MRKLLLCFGLSTFQILAPFIVLLLSQSTALAHSTERGLVMLLPTQYYLFGGGLAVLLSFILLVIIPDRWLGKASKSGLSICRLPSISPVWTSSLSFLILVYLIHAGFKGSTDPLSNPLPLFVWTLWWVGLTSLQFITGNLWNHLNPWTGPLNLLGKIYPMGKAPLVLPEKLGYLPAIIVFAAFAWLELIDIAPDNPARLATFVLIYWLFTFIGMLLYGHDQWRARAEPFSIFFRLIGAFSPLALDTSPDGNYRTLKVCWPGSGLVSVPPLPISGILFVLLTLGSVSFDGFSKTFTWLSIIGINPLEFPGRSAVVFSNTAGLAGLVIILSVAFFTSVYVGCLLAGRRDLFRQASGVLIYSIIPISLVFHMAHYLTMFLVNVQYSAVALNDPFHLGWNIMGLQDYHVTASFLSSLDSVTVIWSVQTVLIVTGHISGIFIAHLIASKQFGYINAAKSQIFLVSLMIFYTVFGLWLLSTASMG